MLSAPDAFHFQDAHHANSLSTYDKGQDERMADWKATLSGIFDRSPYWYRLGSNALGFTANEHILPSQITFPATSPIDFIRSPPLVIIPGDIPPAPSSLSPPVFTFSAAALRALGAIPKQKSLLPQRRPTFTPPHSPPPHVERLGGTGDGLLDHAHRFDLSRLDPSAPSGVGAIALAAQREHPSTGGYDINKLPSITSGTLNLGDKRKTPGGKRAGHVIQYDPEAQERKKAKAQARKLEAEVNRAVEKREEENKLRIVEDMEIK